MHLPADRVGTSVYKYGKVSSITFAWRPIVAILIQLRSLSFSISPFSDGSILLSTGGPFLASREAYELIPSKRGVSKHDYRTYAQRRILIKGKRCAIFTASLIPDRDQAWDGAVFKTPKDDWAEVLLYIVDEDIYVVPRDQMPQETSLSLDSSRIYDYRNSWCVLDGFDPTSSKDMKEYRRRMQSDASE